MKLDYELMCLGILNNMRARAPMVSGELKRNIRYEVVKNGSIFGKITIDVPYARFVDYGYLEHPTSWKLERDYLFVEKSIRNELKNLTRLYGGANVK